MTMRKRASVCKALMLQEDSAQKKRNENKVDKQIIRRSRMVGPRELQLCINESGRNSRSNETGGGVGSVREMMINSAALVQV